MNHIFRIWREGLKRLLVRYLDYRRNTQYFFLKLFLFFLLLNVACYWLAMLTVFSNFLFTHEKWDYFLIQIPVGLFGAMFDSLSFFITIWVIKRAVAVQSFSEYVAHLSMDVIIAIIATFWVLFVFTFSGWIVSQVLSSDESIQQRTEKYEMRVIQAVKEPVKNWKNIYFGLVMGISAMLPTVIHFWMFFNSLQKHFFSPKKE